MVHGGAPKQPLGVNENRYLYNGKEYQSRHWNEDTQEFVPSLFAAIPWYAYGWRNYDPQLGRFHSVDPVIEKHYDYTGYAYVYNNPIRLIDPLGLDTIPGYKDSNGTTKQLVDVLIDEVVVTPDDENSNAETTLWTRFKNWLKGVDETLDGGQVEKIPFVKSSDGIVGTGTQYPGNESELNKPGKGDMVNLDIYTPSLYGYGSLISALQEVGFTGKVDDNSKGNGSGTNSGSGNNSQTPFSQQKTDTTINMGIPVQGSGSGDTIWERTTIPKSALPYMQSTYKLKKIK